MAILTTSGRVGIARSIKRQQIYLAWGTGDASWGAVPPTEGLLGSTQLTHEVGRRLCESVEFCYPDAQGDIITPTGRFSHSDNPTNNLHFEVLFDFEDAEGLEIREFGLFTDTVLEDGLPQGQKYFVPNEIADIGSLLAVERVAPIYRQAMTREQENFVISF